MEILFREDNYLVSLKFGKDRHWGFKVESIKKCLGYFFFSSLSIVSGFLLFKKTPTPQQLLALVLFLPAIYIFNYAYYQTYAYFLKKIASKLSYFNSDNRDNIFDSHAFLLNLLAVYWVSKTYLNILGPTKLNDSVLTILFLFTCFFFLHRSLKSTYVSLESQGRDGKCTGIKLFSLLKYSSYEHSHIFAATTIGLPFLVGLSISCPTNDFAYVRNNAILAYVFYSLCWIFLFQDKNFNNFLKEYPFFFPSAFYPIYLLIFYAFYYSSLGMYNTLLSFSILLYLRPLIKALHSECFISRLAILKEKYILSLVLITIILFRYFTKLDPVDGIGTFNNNEVYVNFFTVIGILISPFLSHMTIIRDKKNIRKSNKSFMYIVIYLIAPYFLLLLLSHVIAYRLFIMEYFENISTRLALLSNHLVYIERLYAFCIVIIVFFIVFPKWKIQFMSVLRKRSPQEL